jgi:Mg2+ and Co2+ transporter CorA
VPIQVADVLAHILFEIDTGTELAIELNESFIHYHDRKMNDVLYILTIVTTCVIPTQLFTGVFGMNFASNKNEYGFVYLHHLFDTLHTDLPNMLIDQQHSVLHQLLTQDF